MLHALGVGFRGLARRADREKKINDETMALARALRHRLACRSQEHPR